MAKSDYICKKCGKVAEKGFLRLTAFHKYTCPKCGTLCEDCVETGFLSKPICKKCGSKCLKHTWSENRWKQS
ncbi:MAG: hypothetical protein IJ681_02435 [Bacteroidales bacterium]|nr:hypothetical protein [Bacteroidales bacterium]